ncbi:(3R)-hydroxymyristoyl-[acyl carrierprotein] dehydratase [Streptococcus sp. HSISB1]|nr:(3R)-hydroxymyristoyl-[acyl carrierprotein] dehydratase [Streptococcus sp. HSISB1]
MLPHRYPFLLVDKVLKYKTGVIECRKNITINEPFFQGHFPGRPIVPGVLMIEMAAQSAALLYILDSLEGKEVTSADLSAENVAEKVGYLASVKNFKFKKSQYLVIN